MKSKSRSYMCPLSFKSKSLRWAARGDFWTFPTKTMWRTQRFATETICNWSAWWSPNPVIYKFSIYCPCLTMVKKRKLSRSSGVAKTILQVTVKDQEGEEDRRRDDKISSRNGVWRFPVGSERQGRVERYCFNVICGALTTAEVKRLRWDERQVDGWKVRAKCLSILSV